MGVLTALQRPHRGAQLKTSHGRLVAQVLAGAWRSSSLPPTSSSDELEEIATLLMRSGAAGLAWCRVRKSNLQSSAAAAKFHQAYRLQSLQAVLHERRLKQVIPLLRSADVEPILVKGWAIARLYPEVGMRPYCDLDLCVLPEHYVKASVPLEAVEGLGTNVDLHLGFGKFYDRRTEAIFARSRLVKLDDIHVRILCEEDNLRYLCMHLLRHGAVRPLWLCDIAVALESRTSEFDWDRCLAGSRREIDWVACTVGLASLLLGVDIEQTPVARRKKNLPRWLVKAVLRDWGIPFESPRQVQPILRQPLRWLGELPEELLRHWPNPIAATMTLRGPLNRLPRLPFQVGHVVSRTVALVSEMISTSRAIQHRS